MEDLELKYVDYETAEILKAMGFPQDYNEPIYVTHECNQEDGDYWIHHDKGDYEFDAFGFSKNDWINAPSLEVVKKWLMNYKDYYIEIVPNFYLNDERTAFKFTKFAVRIIKMSGESIKEIVDKLSEKNKNKELFNNYDDALEWGIKEILKKLNKNEETN